MRRLAGDQQHTLVIQGYRRLMIRAKLSQLMAGLIPDAPFDLSRDEHRVASRGLRERAHAIMNPAGNLTYDVFVNDPPLQDGRLPNGEPKLFSPMASTLIYGTDDAVLTDPG